MAALFHHIFPTDFGHCGMLWTGRGLAGFGLPVDDAALALEHLTRRRPEARAAAPDGAMAALVESVRRYFAGERTDFSAVDLDMPDIDPFGQAIYAAARRLGYGETTTYGALCARAGYPGAARETGTAMGRNPVPLIVPCHRVMAAGGKLGGFSAHGGVAVKRRMLALEGARAPDAVPEQATFAF